MPTLKAVLFDIDDTLFSTTEFARRARGNAVRAMIEAGLGMSQEAVERELDEVILEFSSNYHAHFDKLLMRIPASPHEVRNHALIVAAGNDHTADASCVGSAQDISEIVHKAVVREIRTNIYQGVGHSYCNRFRVSGI